MRIVNTEDTKPVSSVGRQSVPGVIPPFTFVGSITTGNSPLWSPHSSCMLTVGYVQAQQAGTKNAGFAVMKMEGSPDLDYNTSGFGGQEYNVMQNMSVLGSVILPANSRKKVFKLSYANVPSLVTPHDSIMIVSFAASGHQDVVIQLMGEIVV